ncbi:MAG: YHYH protein [Arenicellales bacterium]
MSERNSQVLIAAVVVLLLVLPAWAHELPLGDGKISTSPRSGYLMSCEQSWRPGPVHGGPWIQGESWDPQEKPHVEGSVRWPTHRISITVQGDERIISANNLPDHPTGVFPISHDDPAYRYGHNPSAIRPQHILLRLPLNPRPAAEPTCVPMGMIGFTTDGVAVYNAVDAGGRDAAAHEVQDRCNGHPQEAGQYHYHSPSPCMPNEKTSGLVGYALDGYGIYGMKDPGTGRILHDDDLDACHGTTSPVMWNGRRVDMYHYVLTEEYPYTIGCFRGTPVTSGLMPPPMGGMGGTRNGRQRSRGMRTRPPGRAGIDQGEDPRERLRRAARILGISPEKLREALGPPPPDLRGAARKLGVPLETLRAAVGPPPGGGD